MSSNMQVVIPMSGYGERFRNRGYQVPKPLIEVEGKPFIQHVVEMFPGVEDFVFICNREHLEHSEWDMRGILEGIASKGKIVPIEPHKLGPVHALLEAEPYIKADAQVVVNYCDFTCYWDFNGFSDFVRQQDCDGAVVCYTGFHPHFLQSTNFAYVKESGGKISAIQEKQPYTEIPQNEYASSGTYYFKTGELLLDNCRKTQDRKLTLGGEYYVSLVYQPMLDARLDVRVFEIEHFMQWGTPDDFEEYLYFSEMFRDRMVEQTPYSETAAGTTLIPMAGLGSRFQKAGYDTPKPLINVEAVPMIYQATDCLPRTERYGFVTLSSQPRIEVIEENLRNRYGAIICSLSEVTDGQASTVAKSLQMLKADELLTIGACDNGVIYDAGEFDEIVNCGADIIVWGAIGYPGAAQNPEMYGWIEIDENGDVSSVSVKKPLDNPKTDPIVVGTFTFRSAEVYQACYEAMLSREGLVNGEYYVDELVNDAVDLGFSVKLFSVKKYLCWGTPDDLRRFEYWSACFTKWHSHPFDGRPLCAKKPG